MEFKEKYLKYKMKYTDLKIKQNIFNFLGGACEKNKNFNYADLSSVLDYAKNRYECTEDKKTGQKYLVILYGPPASGKTIARKLASMYIKKHFNESLSHEEIYKSFIDTGVDDLVYDAYYAENPGKPDLSVKQQMINTVNAYFKHQNISDDQRLVHVKENDVSGTDFTNNVMNVNSNTYFGYRGTKRIDDLSALLAVIATYTNHNVFFEIASPSIDYINKLIGTLYWGYNIVFIYPHTDKYELLVERSYTRGLLEGRFVSKEILTGKAKACIDAYNTLVKKGEKSDEDSDSKKAIQTMYDIHKNIMILRYDTELPELYSKINDYTLDLDSPEWKGKVKEFDIKRS